MLLLFFSSSSQDLGQGSTCSTGHNVLWHPHKKQKAKKCGFNRWQSLPRTDVRPRGRVAERLSTVGASTPRLLNHVLFSLYTPRTGLTIYSSHNGTFVSCVLFTYLLSIMIYIIHPHPHHSNASSGSFSPHFSGISICQEKSNVSNRF